MSSGQFEKGREKTGGRKKGSTNKATDKIREAITGVLEANADNLVDWLERIAKDDPKGAVVLYKDLAEFSIPKLSRVEQQTLDADGEACDPITLLLTQIAENDTNDLPNKKPKED